jgi:uncharacterized protein (DUF427 family)
LTLGLSNITDNVGVVQRLLGWEHHRIERRHGHPRHDRDAAWYYPDPKPAAADTKDHIAFLKGVEVSR